MHCPYCGHKTDVTNSRLKPSTNQVWRRRACPECLAIFSSLESADLATVLVVASGKTTSPFDADQLFISIYESLRHRKTAHQDARALYNTIVNKLITEAQNASIARDTIVTTVTSTLRRFDQAARVQYAAYHPLI